MIDSLLILGGPWTYFFAWIAECTCRWSVEKDIKDAGKKKKIPTYTGHLAEVELVAVEAVAGVTFSHANAAAIFTAVQDPTFLRAETLEGIIAAWSDTDVCEKKNARKNIMQ